MSSPRTLSPRLPAISQFFEEIAVKSINRVVQPVKISDTSPTTVNCIHLRICAFLPNVVLINDGKLYYNSPAASKKFFNLPGGRDPLFEACGLERCVQRKVCLRHETRPPEGRVLLLPVQARD